jgi:hypothetical protein
MGEYQRIVKEGKMGKGESEDGLLIELIRQAGAAMRVQRRMKPLGNCVRRRCVYLGRVCGAQQVGQRARPALIAAATVRGLAGPQHGQRSTALEDILQIQQN